MGHSKAVVSGLVALSIGLGAALSAPAGAETNGRRALVVDARKKPKKKSKFKQVKTLPDACTLVTQDEATAVLGEPATKVGTGGQECNWAGASGVAVVTVAPQLLQGSGNIKFAKQQLAQLSGATPVKGVGDAAVEVVNGTAGEIKTVAGNVQLDLTVRKESAAPDPATLAAMAKKAISRL